MATEIPDWATKGSPVAVRTTAFGSLQLATVLSCNPAAPWVRVEGVNGRRIHRDPHATMKPGNGGRWMATANALHGAPLEVEMLPLDHPDVVRWLAIHQLEEQVARLRDAVNTVVADLCRDHTTAPDLADTKHRLAQLTATIERLDQ